MRKLLFICIGAIALSTSSASAQVLEEGNVNIDLYYGFPNLYNAVFRGLYGVGLEGDESYSTGGIGPIGIRGEYMLADKIGLGVDVAYSNAYVSYNYNTTIFNATTGVSTPVIYEEKFATTKIGAMVTFNYHFIDHDALDFYGMIGAGYKNRSFKYTTTDPAFDTSTDVFSLNATLIPVAFRLGVGLRYFFTDNFGLNMAVGFGQGSIINGGISFKF